MRKLFIENTVASTMEAAEKAAPWALTILPAEGGWMAFESIIDALVWSNQC